MSFKGKDFAADLKLRHKLIVSVFPWTKFDPLRLVCEVKECVEGINQEQREREGKGM